MTFTCPWEAQIIQTYHAKKNDNFYKIRNISSIKQLISLKVRAIFALNKHMPNLEKIKFVNTLDLGLVKTGTKSRWHTIKETKARKHSGHKLSQVKLGEKFGKYTQPRREYKTQHSVDNITAYSLIWLILKQLLNHKNQDYSHGKDTWSPFCSSQIPWSKKQVASKSWGPMKGHETNFSPISYK